ncbi:uncharacterized protein BDCG_17043 [Blastomyces dermatitidis ER-3]|uniref:Uncharacterized protein n=2 Tax=Ajellomyces dermatitidis TaxID=5039 RepID=F2TCB9_AJEDA|nr:uncharacterized protein BDCG_17043 [Blastomyces dermatitidis ER-3]EGE80882.1 hypothetical protein BDDG_03823 [Blastomyces dermatitidis ATCC 18188]OAT01343.1 hypothetical protein BDCG_17043 [Blastomyces dermatitidis ER-3]
MGQKHNRRRTRPRSRNRSNAPLNQNPPPIVALAHQLPCDPRRSHTPIFSPSPYPVLSSQQPLLAQQWQNQYAAWQNRDCRQMQEAARMEADQFRLFGGEPGDDVALCYRMLEYFGGLDYIDS